MQGKDVSLILIYDTKGNIAGVQMGVSYFKSLLFILECTETLYIFQ